MKSLPVFFSILLLTVTAPVPRLQAEGPYHLLKEIPVGGEGGWDYLSVDAAGRRLYVSHATKVVVLDLEHDAGAGEIADTPGIHGIALAPELGRVFCSNGREGKVSVVDLKTLQTLQKVPTGENPDAILYEPGTKQVYAFNGRGRSVTIFDAQSGAVTATLPLPGKPEFAAVDEKAGRVYVNIEDQNEVVAIDAAKHEVAATWPIAPGESASGLALDAAQHRLFIGCHNRLMAMMDSTSGQVLATAPIGEGVDANAYDPGTGLAFASCGDGTVTIAKAEAPNKLTVVQVLKTEPRARTMALDPFTHRIYVASAQFEAAPPPAAGAPPKRPNVVPGTFKILVYGMEK